MTDMTVKVPGKDRGRSKGSRGEYYAYFTIIFLIALAIHLALAALALVRAIPAREAGPLKAALNEAHTTTPKIFWA